MRCGIWIVLGFGIAGPRFVWSSTEKEKFSFVFILFFMFYFGNWCISKLEKTVSYAVRRFSGLLLNTCCIGLLIYLFHAHKKYFVYTMSFYYIGASFSFASLLFNIGNPSYLYKIHDYIVCHFIFGFLYILSILQV